MIFNKKYKLVPGEEYNWDIVGEYYHQDEIIHVTGLDPLIYGSVEKPAKLVLTHKNNDYPNAVEVRISDSLVGHLSQDDALNFRTLLAKRKIKPSKINCKVLVISGETETIDDSDEGFRILISKNENTNISSSRSILKSILILWIIWFVYSIGTDIFIAIQQ